LGEETVQGAILLLIEDFAHTLDLKVTAEGVENERQMVSLTDMGAIWPKVSKPLRGKAAGELAATNLAWWVPSWRLSVEKCPPARQVIMLERPHVGRRANRADRP
jgi:hypothetical protein